MQTNRAACFLLEELLSRQLRIPNFATRNVHVDINNAMKWIHSPQPQHSRWRNGGKGIDSIRATRATDCASKTVIIGA
jgi:hypothetical protein